MLYYITPDQWEDIPEDYKTESTFAQPEGRRACFISYLTRAYFVGGSTLCFEDLHFKVAPREERRTFSEVEEANGGHAVECLRSEEARAFYHSGGIKVFEYHNRKPREPLYRWILYAYQWRDEYAEDLTEAELEERLEELGEYEKLEREDKLRVNVSPSSYYWRI